MEISNDELDAVQETTKDIGAKQIRELKELELAIVGGGCGDVVFA